MKAQVDRHFEQGNEVEKSPALRVGVVRTLRRGVPTAPPKRVGASASAEAAD